MQQPTGQYASGGPYSSGPPSDSQYPYTYMTSYGSAPPYTSSPSYYADNTPHQSTPQGPQYVPPQQSLADSMASLNISTQGSYGAAALPQGSFSTPSVPAPSQASVSYMPTVTSYEQSYGGGPPAALQTSFHQQATSSQPPSYVSAGFSEVPPFPQAGYDPLPPSVIGSYNSNPSTNYEPAPPLIGSYDSSNQHIPASMPGYASPVPGLGTGYNPSSSGARDYGASQQGMQGYDYSSSGQVGGYGQGGGMYATPTQGREFDRPSYSPSPAYDATYYEKPAAYDRGSVKNAYDLEDVGLGEVYAYDGGNLEPYGARGAGTGGSWGGLDNFGSGSFSPYGSSGASKLPKAVPKVEAEDKNSGVQRYIVKMLSDASSSTPQNVLCQIGLDGVRMISPTTDKTVRIYPLETITRWEVNEPSVFTFWAKSAVDLEPRRIRLQSGSYTTNAILDTLTAACVQFSEMVGKVDSSKTSTDVDKNMDQSLEKKKPAFVNWMALRNRQLAPEEKQHWVPDEAVKKCSACSSDFGPFLRRHHCRNCGDVFCDKCTHGRTALTADEDAPIVRVCDRCLAEVTQRLSNAKEISNRPVSAPRTHEDLAKKLQEELERNSSKKSTTISSSTGAKERSGQTSVLNCSACGSISLVSGSTTRCPTCGVDSSRSGRESSRGSSWSSSDGSSKRMREVACPTCTVHLQVQVPSSGTETVECGVCQHPFLVSAH
ncbi:hypothetical protein L7F22_064780 [Adiantum nelumboides]|nr:hypothetical protein [Adiantum nelumboides]